MNKVPVAVLGATGAVGQRFVKLLADHPDLELTELVGKTSAGKRYGDAVNWILDDAPPESVLDQEIVADDAPLDAEIVFSALPSTVAGKLERAHADKGRAVFTNAKNHRMDPDVPLVIPEVNPDHLDAVEGRDGFIVANPNCSAIVLTLPLKPLHDAYGVTQVHAVTLQALSGAGYPGVPSLDATGNVVPYIGGEEDKIETEPTKLLGRREGSTFVNLDIPISATATRVPVVEGHTIAIHVGLGEDVGPNQAAATLASYEPADEVAGLPNAPDPVIHVTDAPDRPQPRRDALRGNGMAITVGRVRRDPLSSIKLVVLGSNTIRGAAGCSVLNAELALRKGLLD